MSRAQGTPTNASCAPGKAYLGWQAPRWGDLGKFDRHTQCIYVCLVSGTYKPFKTQTKKEKFRCMRCTCSQYGTNFGGLISNSRPSPLRSRWFHRRYTRVCSCIFWHQEKKKVVKRRINEVSSIVVCQHDNIQNQEYVFGHTCLQVQPSEEIVQRADPSRGPNKTASRKKSVVQYVN
jgi:hypothetical protein